MAAKSTNKVHFKEMSFIRFHSCVLNFGQIFIKTFIKSGSIEVSLPAEGPLSMFHLLGSTTSQALVSFIVFLNYIFKEMCLYFVT